MLDFIDAYDALRRVAAMCIDKEVTHRVVGTEAEIVDETGLKITPDSVYEDLSRFDLLDAPARFCSGAPAISATSARRPTTKRSSFCVRSAEKS